MVEVIMLGVCLGLSVVLHKQGLKYMNEIFK